MRRKPRTRLTWLTVIMVAVGVLVVVGVGIVGLEVLAWSRDESGIDSPSAHRIGPNTAMVKVVEFSDYQCPACREIEPHLKRLIARHGERLQLVFRNYPLPENKNAMQAALAAEAAGAQGKFWRMHDRLFATQDAWATIADPTEYFVLLGRESLVDEDRLRDALERGVFLDKVQADSADAVRAGVRGAPTFFVNGRRVELRRPEDLNDAINQALAERLATR